MHDARRDFTVAEGGLPVPGKVVAFHHMPLITLLTLQPVHRLSASIRYLGKQRKRKKLGQVKTTSLFTRSRPRARCSQNQAELWACYSLCSCRQSPFDFRSPERPLMHPAGKRVAPYEAPKKAFRRFVLSAAVAGGSAASPQSRWTKKK